MALCGTSAAISSLMKREWASENQRDWLVVTQQAWDGDGTHSHQLCLALDCGFGHRTRDKASSEASLSQGLQCGVRHYHENNPCSSWMARNIHWHSATLLKLGAQLCSRSIASRRHFWHLERSIYALAACLVNAPGTSGSIFNRDSAREGPSPC